MNPWHTNEASAANISTAFISPNQAQTRKYLDFIQLMQTQL